MDPIEYIFYGLIGAWVLFRLAILVGVLCLVLMIVQVVRGKW